MYLIAKLSDLYQILAYKERNYLLEHEVLNQIEIIRGCCSPLVLLNACPHTFMTFLNSMFLSFIRVMIALRDDYSILNISENPQQIV